jgi:hypothetical protein
VSVPVRDQRVPACAADGEASLMLMYALEARGAAVRPRLRSLLCAVDRLRVPLPGLGCSASLKQSEPGWRSSARPPVSRPARRAARQPGWHHPRQLRSRRSVLVSVAHSGAGAVRVCRWPVELAVHRPPILLPDGWRHDPRIL